MIADALAAVRTKGSNQFLLSLMETRHELGRGFCECWPGQPTAGQSCSRKVPTVTAPTLLHDAIDARSSCPQRSCKALDLSQADWKPFCLITGESVYRLQLSNASHVAAARTMCHVGTKSARPFIAPSLEPQQGLTPIELLCPYFFGSNRRSRRAGRKLSIPSTSCTQGVQHHQ